MDNRIRKDWIDTWLFSSFKSFNLFTSSTKLNLQKIEGNIECERVRVKIKDIIKDREQ